MRDSMMHRDGQIAGGTKPLSLAILLLTGTGIRLSASVHTTHPQGQDQKVNAGQGDHPATAAYDNMSLGPA
jgi:hypothetical protein